MWFQAFSVVHSLGAVKTLAAVLRVTTTLHDIIMVTWMAWPQAALSENKFPLQTGGCSFHCFRECVYVYVCVCPLPPSACVHPAKGEEEALGKPGAQERVFILWCTEGTNEGGNGTG